MKLVLVAHFAHVSTPGDARAQACGPIIDHALLDDPDKFRASVVAAATSWPQGHESHFFEYGERAVPLLIGMLRHEDRRVRLHAARILGELGSSSVPAVTPVLYSSNLAERQAAAWAMSSLIPHFDLESIRAVSLLLGDVDSEIRTVAAATLALGGMPRVPLRPLLAGLDQPDHELHRIAASGIGRLGPRAMTAAAKLCDCTLSGEIGRSESCAEALAKVAPRDPKTSTCLANRLQALRTSPPDIRNGFNYSDQAIRLAFTALATVEALSIEGIEMLVKFSATEEVLDEVGASLSSAVGSERARVMMLSSSAHVHERLMFAIAIGTYNCRHETSVARDDLMSLLSDSHPVVRETAAVALAESTAEGLATASFLVKSADPKMRRAGVAILRRYKSPRTMSLIKVLLGDTDAEVREGAVGAVRELRLSAAPLKEELTRMLTDPVGSVAHAAEEAIGELQTCEHYVWSTRQAPSWCEPSDELKYQELRGDIPPLCPQFLRLIENPSMKTS